MHAPIVGFTAATRYRGRFAPTPSGPLHLGSLLTAVASYLQARSRRGTWLLRIDDLDRSRLVAGAEARILAQLESHGLLWDEAPRRQSEHVDEYEHALRRLEQAGLVFGCRCTRADLARNSLPAPDGSLYNGHCRLLGLPIEGQAARLRMPAESLTFTDAALGPQTRRLDLDVGDFVLRRRDGVIAYQLACAVDEHAQGITEVVRGADLLSSTFMQVHLMHCLRLRVPAYRHLPVLVDIGPDGMERKLSKQNHALAITEDEAAPNLHRCLQLLGQRPPPALVRAAPAEILEWALGHWAVDAPPRQPTLSINTL